MSNSLQSALSQISEEFAQKVFEVIRTAFIAELGKVSLSASPAPAPRARAAAPKALAPAAKSEAVKKPAAKGERLARRSSESIAQALDAIVGLLKKKPGIGSEEVQKTLGLARNEIARPIALGISTGALRKTGEKRATKYFAGSGAKAATKKAATAKKAAKKAPKKAPKKAADEAATATEST